MGFHITICFSDSEKRNSISKDEIMYIYTSKRALFNIENEDHFSNGQNGLSRICCKSPSAKISCTFTESLLKFSPRKYSYSPTLLANSFSSHFILKKDDWKSAHVWNSTFSVVLFFFKDASQNFNIFIKRASSLWLIISESKSIFCKPFLQTVTECRKSAEFHT